MNEIEVNEDKFTVKTKIRPEILKIIIDEILNVVGCGSEIKNEYHFADGNLRVNIKWVGKKEKEE